MKKQALTMLASLAFIAAAAVPMGIDARGLDAAVDSEAGEANARFIETATDLSVSLFDTVEEIRERMGAPINEGVIPGLEPQRFVEYEGLYVAYFEHLPWPTSLRITGPNFRTARGLGLGATRPMIDKAYGRPDRVVDGTPLYLFSRPEFDNPLRDATVYILSFWLRESGETESILLNFNVQ